MSQIQLEQFNRATFCSYDKKAFDFMFFCQFNDCGHAKMFERIVIEREINDKVLQNPLGELKDDLFEQFSMMKQFIDLHQVPMCEPMCIIEQRNVFSKKATKKSE